VDDSIKTEKYIVLSNSPIEFAISGPTGGRDRLLVRSRNAGLDLIGLAAQLDIEKPHTSGSGFLSLMFTNSRQLNLVLSFPSADVNPETDGRYSRFGFAWAGYASPVRVKKIEKTLNSQLPELYRAIRKRNREDIEWALAPLIYCCTEANERRFRSRRLLLATFAMYGVLILMSFVVALMKSNFFRDLLK
jgi:hypothetical protein